MDTARALTEDLAALLRREHAALAEFLLALADFDRRRVWVELGHSSLWYFLHRELRLSKSAAQYRKVAAELIQQLPEIIEPLRRGDLCLTSMIEVAKVVTTENWNTVLPRFYGLSRREAMEVVAALQPHPAPPVRTVVTPVRSGPTCGADAPAARTLMTPDPQPFLELAVSEASALTAANAISTSFSLREWPLASGGICGATRNLELDHIQPRSLGGASTADNLRVACKPHNDLAARLLLGDDLMDRYTSGLRGPAPRSGAAGARAGVPRVSPRTAPAPAP